MLQMRLADTWSLDVLNEQLCLRLPLLNSLNQHAQPFCCDKVKKLDSVGYLKKRMCSSITYACCISRFLSFTIRGYAPA